MKFVKHNAGKHESKRKKQSNSCTVVALATVCKIPYDTAYNILWKEGRRSGRGFYLMSWCPEKMVNGYTFKFHCPNIVNLNTFNFCQENPKGTFILKIHRHVYAVIDGVVYDHSEPTGDESIMNYVEVIKVKRKDKKNYTEQLTALKEHNKKKAKQPRKKPDFELYLYAGADNEFGDCEFEDVTSKKAAKKRMEELILIEPRRSLELRKWKESQIVEDEILFYCGVDQKWLTE